MSTDTVYTYRAYHDAVSALAGQLRDDGVQPGDVVAVSMASPVEQILAMMAVTAARRYRRTACAWHSGCGPERPAWADRSGALGSSARAASMPYIPRRFAPPPFKGEPMAAPLPSCRPATIVFTSGSSGRTQGPPSTATATTTVPRAGRQPQPCSLAPGRLLAVVARIAPRGRDRHRVPMHAWRGRLSSCQISASSRLSQRMA